jgi:phosphoadenosine phosphosulfate reductase
MSAEMEGKDAQEVLEWAVREFQPGLTMACSFGGPTGMVLLDMVMKIDSSVQVFYLDTDFLFPETYHLREVCEERYGFQPIGYKSLLTPEMQAEKYGAALWARDPDLCCELRKVRPLAERLAGYAAWGSGVRRDESPTRADTRLVDWDARRGMVKVNPLAAWTDDDVDGYVAAHRIPVNPLVELGYASIGCAPCTRPVAPGEDSRAGRWAGRIKVECGVNV